MGDLDSTLAPARELHVDLEVEKAVLGTVILDNRTIGRLLTIVTPSDFYVPTHALLWEVMVHLHRAASPIDVITIAAELRLRERLNTIGGAQYLGELTDFIATTAHSETHGQILAARARCRRAREGYVEAIAVLDAGGNPDLCLADARTRARRHDVEKPVRRRTMIDHCVVAWERMESAVGGRSFVTPTGFAGFDGNKTIPGVTGGMHPSQLWVLAADQGFGKTTWALQVARYVASTGRIVLVFSLEMQGDQLALRMACGDIGVSMQAAANGRLDPDTMTELGTSMNAVAGITALRIIDDCDTMEDIESECLAAIAELGVDERLGLIVIDYAQIVRPGANDSRKTTTEQISNTSSSAKRLAKRGNCPVLLLSQFSREGQKADRKPVPLDLKGSGSLESDADVIVFLWQERGQERQREEPMMAIVAKNRLGDVGEVQMTFERYRTRFSEPESAAPWSGQPPARQPGQRASAAPKQLGAPPDATTHTSDGCDPWENGEGLPMENAPVFPGEQASMRIDQ